jgi:hypothetical protein
VVMRLSFPQVGGFLPARVCPLRGT